MDNIARTANTIFQSGGLTCKLVALLFETRPNPKHRNVMQKTPIGCILYYELQAMTNIKNMTNRMLKQVFSKSKKTNSKLGNVC